MKTWKNLALIGLVAVFSLTACDGDGGGGGGGGPGGGPGGGGGYKVGDTGLGGGKIFYVSGNRYLEISPDLGSFAWASAGFTNTKINLQKEPTNTWDSSNWNFGEILTNAILEADPQAPAAKACRDYDGGGQHNWHLLTFWELYQLGANGFNLGTFTGLYWVASEGTLVNTAVTWDSGSNYLSTAKSSSQKVRAVRVGTF